MKLLLVGLTEDLWKQFVALHRLQKSRIDIQMPDNGLWVVNEGGELVVGLCLYDSNGPWVMAEHLVSNPKIGLRHRFAAFTFALDALRAFATARSKWIIAHPSKKGLARYLIRRGFNIPHVAVLVSPPGLGTNGYEDKKKPVTVAPVKAKRKSRR